MIKHVELSDQIDLSARSAASFGRSYLCGGGDERSHSRNIVGPHSGFAKVTEVMEVLLFGPWMCLVIDFQNFLHRELGVSLGGGETFVTEKLLDGPKIGPFLEHVSAEGVT